VAIYPLYPDLPLCSSVRWLATLSDTPSCAPAVLPRIWDMEIGPTGVAENACAAPGLTPKVRG